MKTEAEALLVAAKREAHRLSQKVSIAAMMAIGVLFHIIQILPSVTVPDELMVAIVFGLISYKLASHLILPFAISSNKGLVLEMIRPPN